MPFGGRPSTACFTCRDKRRKCDRQHPGCSQCARQGLACPGYRSSWEMHFRDETSSVAVKAQRSHARVTVKSQSQVRPLTLDDRCSLKESSPSKGNDEEVLAAQCLSDAGIAGGPMAALIQPKEHALYYFMTSYVVSTIFGEYLPRMYAQRPHDQDALSSAVVATALVTFARASGDDRFFSLGQKEYSAAMTHINADLANKERAVLDRTLATVMTLGLFECMVFQGEPKSMTNWTAHTRGMAELLRLRGAVPREGPLSAHLSAHAGYNVRIACVYTSQAVPEGVPGPKSEQLQSASSRGLGPVTVLERVMNETARIKSCLSEKPTPELVLQALLLAKQTRTIVKAVSDPIQAPRVESRLSAHGDEPHGPAFHAKGARWWYAAQTMRLILIEQVWVHANEGAKEPLISQALGVEDFADDSRAQLERFTLIKQHIQCETADVARDLMGSVSSFLDREHPEGRFLPSGRRMICPLAFLQTSPFCPPEARDEAKDVLARLGRDLRLAQATYASELHTSSRMAGDWLPLCHLM